MLRVLGGIGVLLATTMAGTLLLDLKPQRKMVLFRIQIILIFFMLMCAVTRFVWINLTVLLPSRRTDSKTLLVVHWLSYAFLVIIVALSFFSIPVSRLSIGREPFFITRVAFTCLGLVILLFFNLCFLSAIFTILWFFKCPFANANKWKAVIASAVSIFLCIHGLSAASKGPSVVRKTIPLAKLAPSFYGTTIVQLSDIHLGPMVGSADLERMVNRVLMIKPDIVVITGDLVDSTVEKLKQVVLPLKKLSSRYGVFFVTGNHEYFTGDAEAWLHELKKFGIHPLHNSHVLIRSPTNPEDKIYLAGVDDVEADRLSYEDHGMKLSKALSGKSAKYPTILLAHQPKAAQQALNQFSDIDLILSGHTHGGQFFPMHIPIYLFNPFFAGLYKHKEIYVYVSSGTYFYGIPLRIGSTPEITILTLVQKQ